MAEPDWVVFEKESWQSARESFLKGVKEDERDLANDFIGSTDTPEDARETCKAVDRESGARYATENSFSFTIGKRKVVPKALMIKLLQNLDTFKAMGDVAVKGGPESVGLIWMGIKMGLRSINADFETCSVITSCFADIIGVFISCRLYAQLYGPSLFTEGIVEVQDRVRQEIPSMLRDILEFAFSACKFVRQSELPRWVKSLVKDSKTKFDGKAKLIRDHHARLIRDAEQAAHEENTLRGRTSAENLKRVQEMLATMKSQMEEEKKETRLKTFNEVQMDIFEKNSKTLNPNVNLDSLHKSNLDKRERGTCEWIYGLPEYDQWLKSDANDMMWISGEAGFGKSILLSSIIQRLKDQFIEDQETVVYYFFCRTGNDNTQVANNILANILFQMYRTSTNSPRLLEQCNNILEDPDKAGTDAEKPSTQQPPRTASSNERTTQAIGKTIDHADVFKKMGAAMGKRVILIIDALDECNDDVVLLCSKLQSLLEGEDLKLKLLVSSRPNQNIESALKSGHREIQMKQNNGPDIELKVARGLEKIPGLSQEEQRFACQKITEKAEGEFSYVGIAINILRQPWRRTAAGQRSLEDVMKELPPGMHKSYELVFKQINPIYVELAKTCLKWALLAEGEITVTEIMDAYNGVFTTAVEGADDVQLLLNQVLDKSQQETLAEQMDMASRNFLEIDKKSEPWTIKLRHASVKDYFLKEHAPEGLSSEKVEHVCTSCGSKVSCDHSSAASKQEDHFAVYKKEGHLEMAINILRNLNSPLFQQSFLRLEEDVTVPEPESSVNEPDGQTSNEGNEEEPALGENVAEVTEAPNSTTTDGASVGAAAHSEDEGKSEDTPPTTEIHQEEESTIDPSKSETEEFDPAKTVENAKEAEEEEQLQEAEEQEELMEQPEPDYEGNYVDDEDDYDDLENRQLFEGPTTQNDVKSRLRYEITHWPYHVQEAEKYWSQEERKANSSWKELWDLLEKFLSSGSPFQRWKQLRWNGATYEELPLIFWYGNDEIDPLHVATGLGLNGFVEELLKRDHPVNKPTDYGEAPLHFAAKMKNLDMELLKLLLDSGANPNLLSDLGWMSEEPPFFHLLKYNPTASAVALFIEHGADCVTKYSGNSPLHWFAQLGDEPEVLDLLLAHGADINAEDEQGETPLHGLLGRTDVPIDLLQAFLRHNADLSKEDRESQQPLYEVCRRGDVEAARVILNHEPLPDLADEDVLGMTALHVAAYVGHPEIVRMLKEKGALLNNQDKFGRTPFMFACLGDEPETAKILLEALTGQDFEKINAPDHNGRSPLRKAARHNMVELVATLLTMNASPTVVNEIDEKTKSTALHVAAYNGHEEIVKLLLAKDPDLSIKDIDGKTALMLCHEGWARGDRKSSEAAMLLLIDKSPEEAKNSPDFLCTAARKGSLDVIRALLARGADVNGKDSHGWTSMTTAKQFGNAEAVEFLEKKGAEIRTQPTRLAEPNARFEVSEDGLRLEYVGEDSVRTCIFSDHPIPAGASRYYFEVKLEEVVTYPPPSIGVGLAIKRPKIINRMPGWRSPLAPWWGFHCDDGKLFHWDGSSRSPPPYRPFTYGSTVGCGVDFTEKKIFYTLDGEPLGMAFEDVSGQLFPVIGIGEKAAVRVNFGTETFQWEEAAAFCRSETTFADLIGPAAAA